jgi:putative NADH-flavin reductase
MKLTVVAATGGIGRRIVDLALSAGHEVTAVARNPRDLPAGVRIVRADLSAADPAVIESAVAGADAVLSGLGWRRPSDAGIAVTGTGAIVAAMHTTGVRRVVVVSASPVATVASPGRPNPPKRDPGDGFVVRTVLAPVMKAVLRKPYHDLALMEDLLRGSGLEWTVIRPPRLVDKPLTGRYRTAYGRNLRHGMSIGRADVADLMLRTIGDPESVRQTVGVAY